MKAAIFSQLASATPSMCTWHHCTPYGPEPKWSVNPPNNGPWGNDDGGRGYVDDDQSKNASAENLIKVGQDQGIAPVVGLLRSTEDTVQQGAAAALCEEALLVATYDPDVSAEEVW
ncbi:hypothetical protein T484DRAFT_1899279 [Baffinella frigidus]|nr:hypothetical protein T484DRAFT_1899279 [Cryptophyta sp. CCMP2293]